MLPEYICPQLTIRSLNDFIMNSALESEDFRTVSVETARAACYQYLAHSTVWSEELENFEKELRQDPDFSDLPAYNAVVMLSGTVDRYIRQGEEFGYRMNHLRNSCMEAAMKKAGVSSELIFVEVLLGTLAVSGKILMEKENREVLEAAGLMADDVCRIAECYEP